VQDIAENMQQFAGEPKSVDFQNLLWYKRITESANDCTKESSDEARRPISPSAIRERLKQKRLNMNKGENDYG